MSNVDTTSLRELLSKWQAVTSDDLAPTASLIWVGERQGIQRCVMQLETVIAGIEADAVEDVDDSRLEGIDAECEHQQHGGYEMDPFNTCADRPK